MADEKRQGLENVILYRICMFLWNMMKPVQNPRYAPLPGFSPGPDTPAKQHKTRLRAGGQAAITAPATGKSVNDNAMGQKNDTKSTSLFNIRVYARHQMEPPKGDYWRYLRSGRLRRTFPIAGDQDGGERQWAKNDTKFASACPQRSYARHQMEPARRSRRFAASNGGRRAPAAGGTDVTDVPRGACSLVTHI